MPKVAVSTGIELCYEEHGSGPPLLLIPGTGYWHWCWFKQIPFLSRYFRLIALDNRGCGESDKPDEPYTIPQMAQEAADVLAGLGLERVHVLGTSLGGFIAQELALNNPELVAGLVLVCTALGGAEYILPPAAALAALVPNPQLSPEENLRRNLPLAAAPGYFDANPDEFEAIIRMRLTNPVPPYAATRQVMAALVTNWQGTAERIGALQAPTLVIHGDQDRVVPVDNARRLAAAIPGAELRLLRGAGHLCFIEQAPMFNRMVTEFLQAL